jgi:hypothetical protein
MEASTHLEPGRVEKIFRQTIKDITGLDRVEPLGAVLSAERTEPGRTIHGFFRAVTTEENKTYTSKGNKKLLKKLLGLYRTAKETFIEYYRDPIRLYDLEKKFTIYQNESVPEQKARIVTEIWAPELSIPESDILERWKLYDVEKTNQPITCNQVVIQLNALYTLPESIPPGPHEVKAAEIHKILKKSCSKIADYDHPVPVFSPDKEHELILCLRELDTDIAFEKSIGSFDRETRLPVVVSISVTHDNLDKPAQHWIMRRIRQNRFQHLKVLLLSESTLKIIKNDLLKRNFEVFSVQGKYARHFNALKYMQLLLEKAYGIRAGFKLDTDEGVRSEDLFHATGKSWFQTLCHEYWGGWAQDWRGKKVYLGENIGEYVNSSDIDTLGFKRALREPDVKPPNTHISPDIFFNKAFAHSRATTLYNRFDRLEDFISHTVVKGGGFGIDNTGLRRFSPFTLSCVGRAEDQEFYFYGLSRGLRGIFHPDLRIAHYKERFASAESKTEVHRFVGDMYRLVLFSHLAELLAVKDDIDPMPGIFAGGLAFCQAFFNMVYRAYAYSARGDRENADFIISHGLNEIEELHRSIQQGAIRRMLADEERQWRDFIALSEKIDPHETRRFFDKLFIEN